ncbi:hypothetical protein [Pseudomonas nitroreducens]|uniref:hypothetical protein n=1 Tax=Pseudomonas nitroreducens TaxID=46680 RepID=UPI001FB82F6B|nr:hypothetical protein [Pseudomonas nitroreducens]MCJ1881873.1 hypothetical protein [Pseudomonas nitroreducens]MCJ1898285.1 hypothetical protein [Pseudomonas nitroreducens]
MELIVVGLLGVVVILGVFLSYFYIGDFSLSASSENIDWSSFGSYFGGVAGPLLTFISVFLLVYTIRQQRVQLESMFEENIKQDMLRYLGRIDDEILRLLGKEINVGEMGLVQFGDIVSGLFVPAQVHEASFRVMLERLMQHTAYYCEAIALYRENVNSYFVFKAHRQRAEELVSYLENNLERLGQMAGPSLVFCRMHLEGIEEL